ncbi:MAG: secretin N-terminal domain-containing protein, partial [Candidatus Hydrogenedentales bacterium]
LAAVLTPLSWAQQSPVTPAPTPVVDVGAGGGGAIVQNFAPDGQDSQNARVAQPGGGSQPQATTQQTRGASVKAIKQERRQVTIGASGAFEPILQRKVEYGDVPDEGQPITLLAADAAVPVIELLDYVATSTGWNIIASKGLEGLAVRFWVNEVKPKQVMSVLKFNGIHYEYDAENKFLYVMLNEEYLARQFGAVESAEFQIKHADVIDMESILSALTSESGKLVSDPRTGRILVWDTEANIEEMTKAVEQMDVPLEPRVFALKHLAAEDLLESIQSLLSERGLANSDPRTNSIVVTDLPSRQDQIGKMLEALDQKLETRTWTLNYADPKTISERIEAILPEDTTGLTIDEDTHQVSMTSIPARIEELEEMIKMWDVKGRQVTIEAYLVTASSSVMRNLSINWSYFDEISGVPFAIQSGNATPDYTSSPESGQRATVGRKPYRAFLRDSFNNSPIQEVSNPDGGEAGKLTGNYVLDPDFKGNRVAAVLDYLDRNGEIRILARPRVTVQDGEEASFENTRENAYQTFGFSNTGIVSNDQDTGIASRVSPGSVQFVTTGTILKVKPRINDDANILMEIEAEDSTAEDKTIETANLKSTVPEKSQNKATTMVLVNSGQTLVIGGLRFASLTDSVDKVPILGDIPFLGRLFKGTEKDHSNRELAVFITSTIVDEFTQPEAEELAKFDAETADKFRHSKKNTWGRVQDRMSGGANELSVALGDNGKFYVDGKTITIDELQAEFDKAREAKIKPTVYLRAHPNAPAGLADEVKTRAEAAGLKFKQEENASPFVPSYKEDVLPNDRQSEAP